MANKSIHTLLLLLLLSSMLTAAQPAGTIELGARIGIFSNSVNELENKNTSVRLFGNKRNLCYEGFFGYFILPQAALVVNLGSYSKGDISVQGTQDAVGQRTFIGSAGIYPIQIGVKLEPFTGQLVAGMSPFLEGGGALIIGSESISQLYYDRYYDAWTDGVLKTETDWNWWLGGGALVSLSSTVRLDLMVKYIRIEFSGDIAGIRDYSGWQVSVGIGYLVLGE
ncbi:MAG: outer membrane beta-barrel protein [candidate division Zixibacteria bacterium]|nr:outer membrane beta-barrel protein [candidate division Zixibacteria bacterium]